MPVIDTAAPPPTAPPAGPDLSLTRVPWRAVALFIVLAMGLAWVVELPVWLDGGITSPLFGIATTAMMCTPAIAALIVTVFVLKPPQKARFLGLTPLRPVWSKIWLILIWPLAFIAIGIAALLISQALGIVQLDWSMSALAGVAPDGMTPTTLVALTLLTLPINILISTLAAFGEELGWRGFLVPALAPLGRWPMRLISGVIWGVWHAPVILLGYNYGRTDLVGVLMMCAFTVLVGIILAWSRERTRSVYPAAFGHGALNATATLPLVLIPEASADQVGIVSILGPCGWVVLAIVIAVMVATGMLGRRLPQPLIVGKAITAPSAEAATTLDDHQIVTRSSGASHSASDSDTSNAS